MLLLGIRIFGSNLKSIHHLQHHKRKYSLLLYHHIAHKLFAIFESDKSSLAIA